MHHVVCLSICALFSGGAENLGENPGLGKWPGCGDRPEWKFQDHVHLHLICDMMHDLKTKNLKLVFEAVAPHLGVD